MVLGLQILGDPHLQKQVELALRKILGEQRYVTTANREAYMLVGEISAWEQSSPAFGSHPPLNGVRSGISLQLVNSEGVSIFSYANNYAIHRALDWNRAYSDAFKEIEHDLKTVFIPRFNAFLGN